MLFRADVLSVEATKVVRLLHFKFAGCSRNGETSEVLRYLPYARYGSFRFEDNRVRSVAMVLLCFVFGVACDSPTFRSATFRSQSTLFVRARCLRQRKSLACPQPPGARCPTLFPAHPKMLDGTNSRHKRGVSRGRSGR